LPADPAKWQIFDFVLRINAARPIPKVSLENTLPIAAMTDLTLFFKLRGVYSTMKAGRCRIYLSNNTKTPA
jgi:hypothetical protein